MILLINYLNLSTLLLKPTKFNPYWALLRAGQCSAIFDHQQCPVGCVRLDLVFYQLVVNQENLPRHMLHQNTE